MKEKLEQVLGSGTSECIDADAASLLARTGGTRPLLIKMGIDPTTGDVHLGHMVVYSKIRQLQDLGHRAVLIVGDVTATVGDPTGRNQQRPVLSREEVKENAERYAEQIFRIVDPEKAQIRYQSEWMDTASIQQVLRLAASFTLAELLSHDTFRQRYEKGLPLGLNELFYPVLQAWDSLVLKPDIEMGGTDQKFNILCGRNLMKQEGLTPQGVILMPLLEGTDGRKMSKSFGNHIGVLDSADQMTGKLMSIPDSLIQDYLVLAAGADETLWQDRSSQMENGLNPMEVKKEMAAMVVSRYHGPDKAQDALGRFTSLFSKKELPDDLPTLPLLNEAESVLDLLKRCMGRTSSMSELRRLLAAGAVRLLNEDTPPITLNIDSRLEKSEHGKLVLRVGRKRFFRLV